MILSAVWVAITSASWLIGISRMAAAIVLRRIAAFGGMGLRRILAAWQLAQPVANFILAPPDFAISKLIGGWESSVPSHPEY